MAKLILVLDVNESAEQIAKDISNNSSTEFKVRSETGRRSAASLNEGTVVSYTFKGPKPMAVEQAYVTDVGLDIPNQNILGLRRLF